MFYWSPGYNDFVMSVLKDLNSCQHQHHIFTAGNICLCLHYSRLCLHIWKLPVPTFTWLFVGNISVALTMTTLSLFQLQKASGANVGIKMGFVCI